MFVCEGEGKFCMGEGIGWVAFCNGDIHAGEVRRKSHSVGGLGTIRRSRDRAGRTVAGVKAGKVVTLGKGEESAL